MTRKHSRRLMQQVRGQSTCARFRGAMMPPSSELAWRFVSVLGLE